MKHAIYKWLAISNDISAVIKSLEKKSVIPVIKRLYNKFIGRNIVRKLWWR